MKGIEAKGWVRPPAAAWLLCATGLVCLAQQAQTGRQRGVQAAAMQVTGDSAVFDPPLPLVTGDSRQSAADRV